MLAKRKSERRRKRSACLTLRKTLGLGYSEIIPPIDRKNFVTHKLRRELPEHKGCAIIFWLWLPSLLATVRGRSVQLWASGTVRDSDESFLQGALAQAASGLQGACSGPRQIRAVTSRACALSQHACVLESVQMQEADRPTSRSVGAGVVNPLQGILRVFVTSSF